MTSILDDSGCALPCWHGIVPGKTTIYDGVITYDIESGWLFNRRLDVWAQAFWTSDTVIKYVDICGDEDQIDTTIGDLIEKSGEPEFIISGGNHLGGKDVILIHPKKGVSYWYQTNSLPVDRQAEISADIQIRCLGLFDPTMYSAMMDAGLFSMGFYNAEETMRVMYSWEGYGNLAQKYPSRQP
jgi:hypothetical protein